MKKIVKDLLANCKDGKLYKNNYYDIFYMRESAFAIYIEKIVNGKEFDETYDTLREYIQSNLSEIKEPVIFPREVVYKKGSIPGLLILLFALKKYNSEKFKDINLELVNEWLIKCTDDGQRYYHDEKSDKKVPYVINTSAMVYWYKSAIGEHNENILKKIIDSQYSDGAFPYLFHSRFKQFIYNKINNRYVKKIFNKLFKDMSPYFIDMLHHCVTIFYLVEGLNSVENKPAINKILLSIQYAENEVNNYFNYIKNLTDNNLPYVSNVEPKLSYIRHCNFNDTSYIFYLFASVKKMNNLLGQNKFQTLLERLEFIIDYHVKGEEIKPYLLHTETKCIMNRPAESFYDKAFLYYLGKSYE